MNEQEQNKDITLDDLQNIYTEKYGDPTFADNYQSAGEEAQQEPQQENGNIEESQPTQQSDGADTQAAPDAENGPAPQNTEDIYGSYANNAEILEENSVLKQQVEQLKQQLLQAESANREISNAANQNFAEQVAGVEKPVFDGDAYSYASDEDRARMMSDFSEKLIAYSTNRAQEDIMNKIAPLLKQYQKETEDAEFNDTLSKLGALDGMGDISQYADAIRKISAREEFKGMNPYMRATNAALIAKGLRNANKPYDISARVEEIYSDPELMKALETRRLQQLENSKANVPPVTASNGLSSTVYQPQARAQRLEDLM